MGSIGEIGVLVKTKLPVHGWPDRPARAANRGGVLRLRTLPRVQEEGQAVYYPTNTEAQAKG
jgi:hypothetical protein